MREDLEYDLHGQCTTDETCPASVHYLDCPQAPRGKARKAHGTLLTEEERKQFMKDVYGAP